MEELGTPTPQTDAGAPQAGAEPQPEVTPAPQPGGGAAPAKPVEDVDSLKKQYDSTVGRLGNELEQARRQAEYYRVMAERAAQQQPTVKPQDQDIPEEEFYRNPIKMARQLAREELERDRTAREQRDQTEHYNVSVRNFEIGKNKAFKENPKLFEGIEKPVEDLVVGAWKEKKISAADLADPETWRFLAGSFRWGQGEYDLGKYVKPAAPTPMTAVSTDVPMPGRPKEDETVVLPDDSKVLARMWGADEKEVIEGVKAERKRRKEAK